MTAPSLANISIPSNLQQILASIQAQPSSDHQQNPVPLPPVIGSIITSNTEQSDQYDSTELQSSVFKPSGKIKNKNFPNYEFQ